LVSRHRAHAANRGVEDDEHIWTLRLAGHRVPEALSSLGHEVMAWARIDPADPLTSEPPWPPTLQLLAPKRLKCLHAEMKSQADADRSLAPVPAVPHTPRHASRVLRRS